MKVLVCGGRNYDDRAKVWDVLYHQNETDKITLVIHGDARGVDREAGAWAHNNGVQEVKCPANWDVYPKSAGPIRNSAMLELKPDMVIAFPGGKGTNDMVSKSLKAGIIVLTIDWEFKQ